MCVGEDGVIGEKYTEARSRAMRIQDEKNGVI
jgi:hypothetical protein